LKAVLDSRPGSGYLDSAERYHFPGRYLRPALDALGDWVVLYEPSREGGRAAYVAVARLAKVEPDPGRAGHHFGWLTEHLPFDAPVPLRGPSGYREERLRAVTDARSVGRALQGRSIRPLSGADFAAIVDAGLAETLDPANRRRLHLDLALEDPAAAELLEGPVLERRAERMLSSRLVRDAAFRNSVLTAYHDTCAVTGLRIINGGGRAEAQAAHIVPVGEGGLDIVQNGIALSATAHWLFDRHLISIGEDWRLLVSHNKVPSELRTLFGAHAERIRLPRDKGAWPDPRLVARHRDRFASAA
jgi:putative restriction endonuclease